MNQFKVWLRGFLVFVSMVVLGLLTFFDYNKSPLIKYD